MTARLIKLACKELKPHVGPVTCFWGKLCQVRGCIWASWHRTAARFAAAQEESLTILDARR